MNLFLFIALLALTPSSVLCAERGADQSIDCAKAWQTILQQATLYEESKNASAGAKLWESMPTGSKVFPTSCDESKTAIEYL